MTKARDLADLIPRPTLETEAVAAYTINVEDTQSTNIIQIDFTADTIVTVPLGAGFVEGDSVTLRRKGAYAVTFVPAAGAVIESPDNALKLRAQYSVATLVYMSADTWMLFGDITP